MGDEMKKRQNDETKKKKNGERERDPQIASSTHIIVIRIIPITF